MCLDRLAYPPLLSVVAALLLLANPALADTDYPAFMAPVAACYDSADDDPMARACIGIGARDCMENAPDGGTTVGMMFCLLAERDLWDRLLNDEYAAARQRAQGQDDAERPYHPEFAQRITQLRDAQRAWIAFRDANCTMEYGAWGAGSMRQIAGADCLLRMTAERTVDLTRYLSEN